MKITKLTSNFDVEITVDSDKSISHRCAIFSLLSDKTSVIRNYLRAEDTMNSLKIAQALGAKVQDGEYITITPPKRLQEANNVLDCGNSGTSIRIYSGLLAGIDGFFVLTGDKYLRQRPMKRVTRPLMDIGAKIDGRMQANLAPIAIRGGHLSNFHYVSPIASAQVKSALILAALHADGISTYQEPTLSRDHTERMLIGMGAQLEIAREITIHPLKYALEPLDITVPNDPSSAFFFAVAAAITKSRVVLKNLTLNPTRIEAFKVLEQMGAVVHYVLKEDKYEPIGDIIVEGAELKAVEVDSNIAWLIDELPALAIAMAVADGISKVKNAKELRVKESDRIHAVISNLQKCGVESEEYDDGYSIKGSKNIHSALINSFGDHRIAMSFAILGLVSGMEIDDVECIKTSFPNFEHLLNTLYGK
ncbi:MAG: 3-phosphoshikimate 1-carboxyvinyltransferase [Epsilonproteobacteria bacterium]|nr:3-phosphoshikimate 1-carboxyvinyltransferase [Campylobacterota bacterium]